jgi:hypothetical protein
MATENTNISARAPTREERRNYNEAILQVSLDVETSDQGKPSQAMNMKTLMALKATRFFIALVGVMVAAPPSESQNLVAFAHTELINDKETPRDIYACACKMKPEILDIVVRGLVRRRRASLKRMRVAEATGLTCQQQSEAELSDAQKAVRQREISLNQILDRWILLEDERVRETREREDEARRRMERIQADEELSDWSFEMSD